MPESMPERIIIVDVPVADEDREKLETLGATLVDGESLTQQLLLWPGWADYQPSNTLLVFPGNGASIVRGYFPADWLAPWQWVSVHAKRHWIPGSDPVVTVSRIFPERMILRCRQAVIIDDVFSSGLTARSLMKLNEPWFPGACWSAVGWIKQRAASLRGFAKVYAAREFCNKEEGKENRKVPINSLSTLLENPAIAESYARRNYGNSSIILQTLATLRLKSQP